jgi:hypothetical protein
MIEYYSMIPYNIIMSSCVVLLSVGLGHSIGIRQIVKMNEEGIILLPRHFKGWLNK